MMKYNNVYVLLLLFVLCISCNEQNKTDLIKDNIKSESKKVIPSHGPKSISRNIIQDRKGNIWIASWHGVFRYDGKTYVNITNKVSSAPFFSLLEDRNRNLWFGTIGSGAYYYDGKSFRNFTTKNGLLSNEITCIYEDKTGNIWFGATGGVSRYDGKSFRNYILNGNSLIKDKTGKTIQNSIVFPNEVSSIIEDKTGKFWFGTRGNAFIYDGKKFSIFTRYGKPFMNVRSIIEDKKGNIWLGGPDGLWRYNSTFTTFTKNFVECVYEDRKGNIWTCSEENNSWVLSRYDEKSLSKKNPIATQIKSKERSILFGILESKDSSIWFCTGSGVYRYDGKIITDSEGKEVINYWYNQPFEGLINFCFKTVRLRSKLNS